MRPIDVEAVGPDGAARRGARTAATGSGRCSWVARAACRTWCWRWRSIPAWAAASRSWRPRSRCKRLGDYVARRARTPTPTSSSSTARARLIASGGTRGVAQAGGAALRRARARASCRRPSRSPNTPAATAASSARSPRSVRSGFGVRRQQDRRRRAAAGEPHPPGHAVLDRRLRRHRVDRGAGVRAAPVRSGRAAGRRIAPDRRGQPRGAHRAGRRPTSSAIWPRRSTRWRLRSTTRAPKITAADRRDHGLEPDAGEAGRGQDARAAPGPGHAPARRARWRRWASSAPASPTRSTTRWPACWGSSS